MIHNCFNRILAYAKFVLNHTFIQAQYRATVYTRALCWYDVNIAVHAFPQIRTLTRMQPSVVFWPQCHVSNRMPAASVRCLYAYCSEWFGPWWSLICDLCKVLCSRRQTPVSTRRSSHHGECVWFSVLRVILCVTRVLFCGNPCASLCSWPLHVLASCFLSCLLFLIFLVS